MFYVGDILWLEGAEWFFSIPNYKNFSGCIYYPSDLKRWYVKGLLQSFRDPVTKEWMPAVIYPDGREEWYDRGMLVKAPENHNWKEKKLNTQKLNKKGRKRHVLCR